MGDKPVSNNIQIDAYDPIIWESLKGASSKVRDLVTTSRPVTEEDYIRDPVFFGVKSTSSGQLMDPLTTIEEYDNGKESIISDTFYSLYKFNPNLIDEPSLASKTILEAMMNLPEYKQLRSMTRLDDISSALGLMKLAPGILKSWEELQKEIDKKTAEGKPDTEALTPEVTGGIRQTVRAACEQAQKEVEEWNDIKEGWGIKPGEIQRLPLKNKLALANKLKSNKNFKKIADLAGRFRNIALSAAAVTPSHGMDEIVDIAQGDDLSRLLPSELLKFKRTRLLFLKDYVEKKLTIYNLRGTEPLGAGPIVALLDISASMEGEREIWAKAVIFALIALAEKQKRAFGFLTFDTKVRTSMYISKEASISIANKMDIMNVQSDGGGTDFYAPLKSAFEMRAKTPALHPADFVLITDGECELKNKQLLEIQALKESTSVRILGIAVTDGGNNECSGDSLDGFADNIAVIDSLGDISYVKGIMSKVAAQTIKTKNQKRA